MNFLQKLTDLKLLNNIVYKGMCVCLYTERQKVCVFFSNFLCATFKLSVTK